MRFRHIWTVLQKELLDTVRDRRSLLMIIVVPLFIMPIFVLGPSYLRFQQEAQMLQEFQAGAESERQGGVEIVVQNAEDAPELLAYLARAFRPVEQADAEAALQAGKIALIVTVSAGLTESLAQGEPASVAIRFNQTQARSRLAREIFDTMIQSYRQQVIARRLQERGLDPKLLEPFAVSYHNMAPPEQMGGFILSFILPLFLVMWAAIGGSQTAIDITVGEKERKTLETLLVAPISRESLALGKVLAIFTVTVVAAMVSVLGFVFSLRIGAAWLGHQGELRGFPWAEMSLSFTPLMALLTLAVAAGIAAMMSALIFALFLWTRSIREAQSHTTWITFGVMIPVFAVQFKEFTPDLVTLLIPIFNATLVFKELLLGKLDWFHIGVTLTSSLVYALVAIWIAVRVFQSERVLFRQ